MAIGRLTLHRMEQWDLGPPSIWPIIVAHWSYTTENGGGGSRRIFCLWRWGIRIGRWQWALSRRKGLSDEQIANILRPRGRVSDVHTKKD